MLNLETNKSKILSNKDKPTNIGYDTRIYKEYNSLAAACLFNKVQSLFAYGEFGITDLEFSKKLGMTKRTFERGKSALKNRIEMRVGDGNRTYYSIKEGLPYDPISYRSFDLNHWYIMDNSLKGAAFLGQLLYWWKKELVKGSLEFSKTDKQIINDLPFLSNRILPFLKEIAVLKGFITIKRKKRGNEWGVSHYTINPLKIEAAIDGLKNNNEHQPIHTHLMDQIILVSAKMSIESPAIRQNVSLVSAKMSSDYPPKCHLTIRQNVDSTIINTIDTSIISRERDQKSIISNHTEVEKKERNEIKNEGGQQPMPTQDVPEGNEIFSMVGTWKEIVSSHETINLSPRLKDALSAALKQKFHNSLDEWKAYCTLIAENEWLMGKNDRGWKVQLAWAIRFESVDKVLAGTIYGKKKLTSYKTDQPPISVSRFELVEELMLGQDSSEIKEIKLELINKMDKYSALVKYHTYFRKANFEILEEGSKNKLIIKSSYGAFNSLLSYHGIIAKACADAGFDGVTIFGGTNDRAGNNIFMEREFSKNVVSLHEEENLTVHDGIKSLLGSLKGNEDIDLPEKRAALMD